MNEKERDLIIGRIRYYLKERKIVPSRILEADAELQSLDLKGIFLKRAISEAVQTSGGVFKSRRGRNGGIYLNDLSTENKTPGDEITSNAAPSKLTRNMDTETGKQFWESAEKIGKQVYDWPASKRAGINVENKGITQVITQVITPSWVDSLPSALITTADELSDRMSTLAEQRDDALTTLQQKTKDTMDTKDALDDDDEVQHEEIEGLGDVEVIKIPSTPPECMPNAVRTGKEYEAWCKDLHARYCVLPPKEQLLSELEARYGRREMRMSVGDINFLVDLRKVEENIDSKLSNIIRKVFNGILIEEGSDLVPNVVIGDSKYFITSELLEVFSKLLIYHFSLPRLF